MSSVDRARELVESVPKKAYVHAVGPRLRVLLYVVFALVALLSANAFYLFAITMVERVSGDSVQGFFYLCMFLCHLALGLLLILPFLAFGFLHMLRARKRRNRRAVKIGYALFTAGIVVLVTGVLLMIAGLRQPLARGIIYWLHVLIPLAAAWLYWLHRLAGPKIKWRIAIRFGVAVGAIVLVMVILQAQDPRDWFAEGPPTWKEYGHPSLAQSKSGKYIPEHVLMNDEYCLRCHKDIYDSHLHSAHRFSSFNNPAYLASVMETREIALKRDGDVKASRWCAGCHDPVPFFSGKFDDPDYDIINDPTAHAGITCTVCHAITNVNSVRGNADYTLEEPLHYPFAYSDNRLLQSINNQLVKAKPRFHKASMLKPFHKTAEFCSACHKVHLPKELNHYKEFVRGQNHYDSFLLSGVSGHGARSFYYPKSAQLNCNGCHMPLMESKDFGAKDFDDSGHLSVHSHAFPSANTGIAYLKDLPGTIAAHQEFLQDIARVDIFGLREGGAIDGPLIAPLRPDVTELKPGKQYLLETVIRTLKLGHLLTQGTADSNEIWLDVSVTSGGHWEDGKIVGGTTIGRNGGRDSQGNVDPWSHFVNAFVLDQEGNRIDRRNAQDIFTPLYNNQIPPGAGQVVHYELNVPEDATGTVTVEVKLQYRKFDATYMQYIADFHEERGLPLRDLKPDEPYVNQLPITTLASDRVVFQIEGSERAVENPPSPIEPWQRWNDYGIGLLLAGKRVGQQGQLRQAKDAFTKVSELGVYHGPLNLARVYTANAAYGDAIKALKEANQYRDKVDGFPVWTLNWLTGVINAQQGKFDEAIANFRSVVSDQTKDMLDRQFDFSKDYVVLNDLGRTLFERAKKEYGSDSREARDHYLNLAIARFQQVLELDPENVKAHSNLNEIYKFLGDEENALKHQRLHERFKSDENISIAINAARARYPAANRAAQALVIHLLNRPEAPELPEAAWKQDDTESGPPATR